MLSFKMKLPLAFFLFSLFLLLAGVAFANERDDEVNPKRPEERQRECERQCDRRREGREKSQCRQKCEEEYRREKGGGRGNYYGEGGYEDSREREEEEREREREGGQRGQSGNPYLFEDEHFMTEAKTEHGRCRVLPKFTERSELFRGIENYRVGILEADPHTFIVPHHKDAECLFFVARGKGTISLVRKEKRESFNIRSGDVMRVPAGTTKYMINRDSNEKLVILELLKPVSNPGEFEVFIGAGGENPESFYRVFSNDVLEAALNTKRDRLEKLFGQQRQGVIVKASEEQIRALSRHEEGGIWPFRGESRGLFNLFNKRPSQSNQHGQLHEIDTEDCRQLEELDVSVSFANITQGSMTALMYLSKATKITTVVGGEGYLEMACPHLSSSSEREGSPRRQSESQRRRQGEGSPTSYQKVRARLRSGSIFIIPPGHPFAYVASNNQNLQLFCFEINASDNQKVLLAGRRNIINQMEREAKELAFNVPAREVDEIFRNQNEEYFLRGPRQQQEEEGGRADA